VWNVSPNVLRSGRRSLTRGHKVGRSNSDIAVFETMARRDASLHWYAIADSAQHPSLPAALLKPAYQSRCLFGASPGSPVAEYAPHLVELGPPIENSSAWDWVSIHAKSKPCVSVIATQTVFDKLFRQLAGCTEVVLPGEDVMFFAFWDPAILGTLMGQSDDLTLHVKGPVLDPAQRFILTNGLAGWWYWDRTGGMHAITVEELDDELPVRSITLTQDQVDNLVEASVPHHVLYYLEFNHTLLIANLPLAQRYDFICKALLRARDVGLISMGDLVNFLCMELIYGENMYKNRTILDLLSMVKGGQLTFYAALEEFP
jgi:hypothetical protein